MRKFFEKIHNVLCDKKDFVLVSVVSSSGSTPRGNGARMAVFADGSIVGTIGGGAVEYLSIQMAVEALGKKTADGTHQGWIKGFNLNRGQTADIGMICGGQVDVCFQYIDGKNKQFHALVKDIVSLFDKNTDAWLVTRIEDGTVTGTGIYEAVCGLKYLPDNAALKIKPFLKNKAVLTDTCPVYFVEPLMRAGFTWIFGGGHVSQALVPVISGVGFKTVVYEDRESFAREALFSGVYRTILADYTKINSQIYIDKNDFVVIMTRGHQSDYEVLSQVLKTPAAFIGVIGSRTKMALTKQRLLEDGFCDADLDRLHTPIGLDIKAETPAEIAVSVAAEMILCRAQYREKTDVKTSVDYSGKNGSVPDMEDGYGK